jgi:uncharacterized protein
VEFGESQVSVEFLDRGGATEVQITHEQLPNDEVQEDHKQGWNGCLDKLEKLLAAPTQTRQHAIVWCDIPVRDLDRAIRFYSAVLGTPLKQEQCEGMTFAVLPRQGEGVSGCLSPGCEGNEPSQHGPLVYLNCEGRLDEALAAIEPNGGQIFQPKHQIGPYGFRAVVLDSEGNRIALHSQ